VAVNLCLASRVPEDSGRKLAGRFVVTECQWRILVSFADITEENEAQGIVCKKMPLPLSLSSVICSDPKAALLHTWNRRELVQQNGRHTNPHLLN
jgi:hypothetical protein